MSRQNDWKENPEGMGKLGKKNLFLLLAIAFVLILIIVVFVSGVVTDGKDGTAAPVQNESAAGGKTEHGIQIIQVERETSVETLEEGLRDIGLLVTQEYIFTDAVSQSKVKTLFSLTLGFTESSYLATYDGVVSAGIDFAKVSVELDRDEKIVTVKMPKAVIQAVDIDPASFVLYSEKNGIGNPLSVSDFNGSLVELEEKARSGAIERGILEQADANAKRITETFIGGLLDLRDYNIIWNYE